MTPAEYMATLEQVGQRLYLEARQHEDRAAHIRRHLDMIEGAIQGVKRGGLTPAWEEYAVGDFHERLASDAEAILDGKTPESIRP